MTDPAFLDLANDSLRTSIPVVHGLGVRIVEVSPGHVVTEVPFEGNGNHIGTMYAGVLFTVAEVLGGILGLATFDPARFYPLVRELTITYLKPARSNVRATADMDTATIEALRATAEAHGKADFDLEAHIVDEQGTLVATTAGRYQLRTMGS